MTCSVGMIIHHRNQLSFSHAVFVVLRLDLELDFFFKGFLDERHLIQSPLLY